MARVNRGKQFEECIHEAFIKHKNTSIIRLQDNMGGYAGVSNICDFIAYNYPKMYLLECKSTYGNTLSINSNNPKHKYGDITNNQWEGLLKQSHTYGVVAGVVVWFIDHDITIFVPIQALDDLKKSGSKSLNVKMTNFINEKCTIIQGKKKRVLFDYDITNLLKL